MTVKRVEVLVFGGCPHAAVALERVRMAIHDTNVEADMRVVNVESEADADHLRFLGSPTVRVDGVDVEPSAMTRSDFGLQCRVYNVEERIEGAPPTEWIASALRMESRQPRDQ